VSSHQLLVGRMGHHRAGTVRHGFTYPVFFLALDVDALDNAVAQPSGWPWPLGLDRPGLLSVRRRDFGPRDGGPLGPWLRRMLAAAGLPRESAARIVLHTFPRVFGLGFNPVNFWLCHDAAGAVRALFAEVSNTFGEHHSYLVAHPDGRAIAADDLLEASKVFHVSPFFPVAGRYHFRVRSSSEGVQVRISYGDGRGQHLNAYLQGSAQPFSTRALLQAFFRHPLQALTVLSRIHWHALLLWRKGVRFHRKPAPPIEEISVERH
jgi:DUF1365 family protein